MLREQTVILHTCTFLHTRAHARNTHSTHACKPRWMWLLLPLSCVVGVHKSDVLVVLATKGVLTQPWCLLEMWEAALHEIPIVLFPVWLAATGLRTMHARCLAT